MTFEEDLDKLTAAINRSRSKKLKVAYVNYLNSFNASLRNYLSFLQFLNAFQLPAQKEEWTHSFERRRD